MTKGDLGDTLAFFKDKGIKTYMVREGSVLKVWLEHSLIFHGETGELLNAEKEKEKICS